VLGTAGVDPRGAAHVVVKISGTSRGPQETVASKGYSAGYFWTTGRDPVSNAFADSDAWFWIGAVTNRTMM